MKSVFKSCAVFSILIVNLASYCMDEPFHCKVPRDLNVLPLVSHSSSGQELKQAVSATNDGEQKALHEFIEQFKKMSNSTDANPMLREEVQKILDNCGITEPVTILEKTDTWRTGAFGFKVPNYKPLVKIMGIGTKDMPGISAFLKFNIYHECAHIFNRDLEDAVQHDNFPRTWNACLSGAAGLTLFKLTQHMQAKYKQIGIAVAGGAITYSLLPVMHRHVIRSAAIRNQERAADRFAVHQLVKQEDILPILAAFMYYSAEAEGDMQLDGSFKRNVLCYLKDHPSNKERALLILQELEKSGFTLNDIFEQFDKQMANPADEQQVEAFTEINKLLTAVKQQVEKHFPEFLR